MVTVKRPNNKDKNIKLADFNCLPIILWRSKEYPQKIDALIEFINANFKSKPVCIYSVNPEAIHKRGSQRVTWINKLRDIGWSEEDLDSIYFVNLVANFPSLKSELDYLFLEYIRNKKFFKRFGFTHFLWISEDSNLKNVNKLLKTSMDIYAAKEKVLLIRPGSSDNKFPSEGLVYCFGWFFLTEDMISCNDLKEYNYFV